MKFTLSWLKEHLETDATLEQLTDGLTDLGLELEEVIDPTAKLANFKIGYVEAHEQHPDADRLRVCTVQTADGTQQIICGAPNARKGIYVVVAQPGDYIPGLDITIQVGKIRGVDSFGMMASERELELSDEHDGIIELDGDPQIGEPFVDYLARNNPSRIDPVIDIAITPNRPDAWGVRGIARDLAARGLGALKPLAVPEIVGKGASPIGVTIDNDTLPQCPVFYGRVIKGVKNGPSPEWLQSRLRAIGLRPISALVDITNYMTFDLNRPLHVFDADKVSGDLRVHRAKGGETLIGLDDKEYGFDADMTIISDANAVESIGGVMGGAATGATDETVNVFLEAAYFDPIRTATTGRKLNINSDARTRFERGIDPQFVADGFAIATQMVVDLCGGEPTEAVIAGEMPNPQTRYPLDYGRVKTLVGMDIDPAEQEDILTRLGFVVEGNEVLVPSWRPDVQNAVDLIEEIVRVKSLTQLVGEPMLRETPGALRPVATLGQKRASTIRRQLAALGMNEVITYSFIDEKSAKAFGGGGDAVKLANPISQDLSHLRPNLYAGLTSAAVRNSARGFGDLALFELGQGFSGGEPKDQFDLAAGIFYGASAPRNAHGTARAVDVYDAKAPLEAVLSALGQDIAKLTQLPHDAPYFHPARSAKLGLGPKNIIAEFGELHPKVTKALGLRGRVIAFAIEYNKLPKPKVKSTTRSALVLNDLQIVTRDLALVVDANTEVGGIIKTVGGVDRNAITNVSVFDVFDGEKAAAQMGKGKKSVAISLELTPKDKTFTEDDIKKITDAVLAKLAKSHGAILRG